MFSAAVPFYKGQLEGSELHMFKDEFKAVVNGGVGKINFLKNNPLGYFVAAMVAGMFISFGSFVAFTLGAVINAGDAASWTKPAQAFAFA